MSIGAKLGTTRTQDIVLLGALGLAAYVVYNLITGVKKTADMAASIAHAAAMAGQQINDNVVNGLAQVWVAARFPPNIVPSGAIRLPNGALVPASRIAQLTFDSAQNLGYFNYLGVDYQITPQQWDNQGNLIANEVPDFGLTINSTGGWS